MEAQIGKRWTFDAAHQLLHHDGKCARPHGHTYSLQVTIGGPIRGDDQAPTEGMIADYGRLSEIWREHFEPLLDHQDLNETLGPDIGPTTAENIAAWAFERWDELLSDNPRFPFARLLEVRVSETANTFATVFRPFMEEGGVLARWGVT